MDEEFEVNATEAKLHFGEILNRAVYGDKVTIVTRHGKPVAVVANIKQWNEKSPKKIKEDKDVPQWLKKMRLLQKKIAARRKKLGIVDTSDSVKIIREIRDNNGR